MKIQHNEMVRALAKPGDAILASLTPEKTHLIHMAIGISGEAGELMEAFMAQTYDYQILDRENVVEELGDLEFYNEGLRQGFNLTRDETILPGELKTTNGSLFMVCGVVREAGVLLDVVKKYVVYNKSLDIPAVVASLSKLEQFMAGVRIEQGISREETIEANINKLGVRYKDGYSDKAAQIRVDKQ